MVKARGFFSRRYAPDPVVPTTLEFGAWRPDLDERDNPGCTEALNVVPHVAGGFAPFRSFVGDPIYSETVTGARVAYSATGKAVLYAAGSTGIGRRAGSTFFNVLDLSANPVSGNMRWQFPLFGDLIVALHPELTPQACEVGGADPFTPLDGSPPTASCGARVGNFLVLGNLISDPDETAKTGATGPFPRRIRWSAFNNVDAPWVSDPATQADFQDMPGEGGNVVSIVGREVGYVFQQRSISRMTYIGLPAVFDIQVVEQNRGALCAGGVVDIGIATFFIAEDGFFLWNGTNATPIADGKVNKWFRSKLNYTEKDKILGAVDYANNCIVWAFPSTTADLTDIIIYNYVTTEWSRAEFAVEYLLDGAELAVSLDSFIGMDLDTDFPESLDSLLNNRPTLAAFALRTAPGPYHQYGTFSGAPMAATVETGLYSAPDGGRWFVNSCRAMADVSNTSVVRAVARMRDQLIGDPDVYTPPVAPEITGEIPLLADARYMGLSLTVSGGTWSRLRGIELWRKKTGRV